jgi:serine/threonine-protein kinase
MTIRNQHLSQLGTRQLAELESAVARFEEAWERGERPAIAPFLPADFPTRQAALVELVQVDLEYRGRAGDRPDIHAYLAAYPELAANQEVVESLLAKAARPIRRIDPSPASWTPDEPHRLGKFELLEMIGQGSFGTVFRARDVELDRMVAVKTPRAARFASKEQEERFLREAQSTARLHHPGIVSVHEVGRGDSFLYIVSEFVEGRTLAEALESRPFTWRESALLIAEVAEALEHAHQQGVIHRDLKPSNIMLQRWDEDPAADSSRPSGGTSSSWNTASSSRGRWAEAVTSFQPRLMDFGLARRLDAETSATMEGDVLGTPAYMSPEQARGEAYRVDDRGDLYSLGVILFQLLTGELPFRGTVRMLLNQVLQDEPPRPRRLNERIPRDLETITLKCLAKDPAHRYPTSAELAAELRRYLDGRPILARPVGPIERFWRWCRRNPVVASLAALTIAAVLFGLTALGIGYASTSRALIRVTRAQAESEASLQQAKQAVDDLFTRVSEDVLLNQPGMQPVRKDLLLRARDYYARFLARQGNSQVPEREVAMTHFRVGLICEEIETPDAALPEYQAASAIQRRLVRAGPHDLWALQALGDTLNAMGRCWTKQQLTESAATAHGEAIAVRRRAVALRPDDVEANRRLANSYMNLGLMRQDQNPAEAGRQMELGQSIRRELLRKAPGDLKVRRDLGMGCFNLAKLARANRQPAEAKRLLAEAIPCFAAVAEATPADLTTRYQLALCHRLGADLKSERGEREAALETYGQARPIMEGLAQQNPSVVEYRVALAEIYLNLGQTEMALKHREVALDLFLKAQAILAPCVTEDAGTSHATEIPRDHHNYLVALQMAAQLQAASGQRDQAIATLGKLQQHLQQLDRQHPKSRAVASQIQRAEAALSLLRGNKAAETP